LIVSERLFLLLVDVSDVFWPIIWNISKSWKVLLVSIVGGLIVVGVVEEVFVGCSLVNVGRKLSLVSVGRNLLLELVAVSNVIWSITWTISEVWRILLVIIVKGLLAVVVVELELVGYCW
jgi:hypothetical protein